MSYENVRLIINHTEHRFEIEIDHQKAFIDYEQKVKKVYLIHTEVAPPIEGKGVAAALVEKTLTYLDEQHLQLVPLCSYVQQYLQKHPEWNKIVSDDE